MTTSTSVERRRLRARLALLSFSTILSTGLAAPAMAQSSPTFRNLDTNGVDLGLGDFVATFPEGSIGSGDAEIALTRIISGGTLTSNWDTYGFTLSRSGNTLTIKITKPGRRSDTFTGGYLLTSYTPNIPNGASLVKDPTTGTYVYTQSDGTSVTFINPDYDVVPLPANGLCAPSSPQSGCTLLAEKVTDSRGNDTYLSFDSPPAGNARKLLGVSNAFGYGITFSYSGYTRTGATFTRDGTTIASVSYSYPGGGAIDITDMAGNVWHLTSTSITRPGESTASFSVGGTPTAVTSVTRDGITTSYARTVSGSIGTMVVTDALGKTSTIVSNLTTGRPTSVTDAYGKITSYSYDTYGRLTRVTQPENNYVELTLDGRSNATQTRQVAKPGSGLADIVTSASYDATCSNFVTCNKPNSTTDARNNVTNYTYNATTGAVTSVTEPAPTTGAPRPQMRYSYSGTLLIGMSMCQTSASCTGGADEVKTTIGYDSYGNVTSVAKGAGDGSLTATTTATYTAFGDVATINGPLAGTADTTIFRYDAARRQVGAISADPDGANALKQRAQKTTYDAAGRATVNEIGTVNGTTDSDWAAFASAQAATTTYVNSRKAAEVLTAGGTTYQVSQYSYDADGRLQCSALRMNSAAWGTLPSSACSLGTTGIAGPDRIGKTTYDDVGRVTKTQSALLTPQQSDDATGTYNDNGTLATLSDANGNKTTYEYDGFDRLLKTRYPSATTVGTSSTTDYEQLVYGDTVNVTSRRLRGYASDSNQHIDYSYDALNRATLKNLPGSEPDVSYTYDLLNRPLSAATSAQTLTFTYDALSRNLTQGGPLGTVTATYDVAGRRTRLTWPDSFYVTYDYLVTGEQAAIRENGAASGIGVLARYGYDDLGRRISLTRGNGTTTSYTPDGVSRLSSLVQNLSGTANDLALGFTYNPASQIATVTRSNDLYAWAFAANRNDASLVNGLNQATSVGGTSLGYDVRGNLSSSGSASYTYSSENLLLTGPSSAALIYDPLLRLYQESGASVAPTRLLYDGQAVVAEYDSSAVVQKRYIHGPDSDEPVVRYDRTGGSYARSWLHADERRSIIAQSDDTGTKMAINSYDEYGVPASSNVGRFGYTGQTWLPSLGIWNYKARMYSPTLGRFMQTDPIGYGDGMNWYNYAGGDPINRVDPMGLNSCYTTYFSHFKDSNDNGVRDGGEGLTGNPIPVTTCIPQMVQNADSGGGPVGAGVGKGTPKKEENLCKSPAVQAALKNPDFKNALRDARRMSQDRGNTETGFNFGSYLTGGRGFGDAYPGYRHSIIFRDGIDSLLTDGIWNPDVHFHLHPPGYPAETSTADANFARSTNAIVVAISPSGSMDCTNG